MREKRKYIPPVNMSSLPMERGRSIFLGKIAGTESKAFFDIDMLPKHAFISGGSGTGKSITAMVIAEECLSKGICVIVFDTSGNWKEFAARNNLRYMESQISYNHLETDDTMHIENGSMKILNLSQLTENDYNEFIKNNLSGMIYRSWDTTDKLGILLIFEDAYKLSPRFGGQAAIMLEKACREFRKFGIGIMLITHSYSDFGPAVLGNVNTEIWFKTSQEDDLQRIRKRYGPKYASALVKLRIAECMVANVDYNYSKPWFVELKQL